MYQGSKKDSHVAFKRVIKTKEHEMKNNRLIMAVLAVMVMAFSSSVAWAGGYSTKSYHEKDNVFNPPGRHYTGPFTYGNQGYEWR